LLSLLPCMADCCMSYTLLVRLSGCLNHIKGKIIIIIIIITSPLSCIHYCHGPRRPQAGAGKAVVPLESWKVDSIIGHLLQKFRCFIFLKCTKRHFENQFVMQSCECFHQIYIFFLEHTRPPYQHTGKRLRRPSLDPTTSALRRFVPPMHFARDFPNVCPLDNFCGRP